MANIEMLCPHCGHQLRIPDRFAGQKGGCIHCKGRFTVPDGSAGDLEKLSGDFSLMSPSALGRVEIDGGGVEDPGAGMSLSALERMDIEDGEDPSSVFAEAEQGALAQTPFEDDTLGCFFWVLAFHLPPVALIWALFLPKGHSQKAVGLGVSAGFLLLAVGLMAAFSWLFAGG